jgi:hypothetical protein
VDISFGQLFSVSVAGLDCVAESKAAGQHKLASEPGTLSSYVFISFCHEISIY